MSGEYPPPITIRDNCAVPEWTHNQAEPDSEAVALAHVACSTISVVCCAFVLLARACRWAKDVKDGMSAIEPVAYRDRFLAGMGHQLGLQQGPASTNRV